MFKLKSPWSPSGDQPSAIEKLTSGLLAGDRDQVLLGVTGSGKTYTMANIIQNIGKPAMIMAPNKTLAAQLYEEMRGFFPENAVEYFVSYYDYYQPEAYIPQTDTFIEKDAVINEYIDRLRHSATRSLLERRDVIVVCSVSCIYGLGNPETYGSAKITLKRGVETNLDELLMRLAELRYERATANWHRGQFRVKGDTIDIFPTHAQDFAWRIQLNGKELERLRVIDATTCTTIKEVESITIYSNSHYLSPRPIIDRAVKEIKKELKERLNILYNIRKTAEAARLDQRVKNDIEMMLETGMCKGIEHYSRYLNDSKPGEPPPTLFGYLQQDALLFVDESHVSVPQISGMYNGDRARKQSLIEYGFRLPSALDNRPLTFDEWNNLRPQTIFVSATPGKFERDIGPCAEQIIRPTGLIDPMVHIRPVDTQIKDVMSNIETVVARGERALITTLTRKMAEHVNEYLLDNGFKSEFLHSEVKTLQRIEIILKLRKGEIDVIVGVNLLREGLDIPECSFVGILDGDKEGFLRSTEALLQTIGRAARNINGTVIIYADKITRSIENALSETQRRRDKQLAYNEEHGITPKTIEKAILNNLEDRIMQRIKEEVEEELSNSGKNIGGIINDLEREMREHADSLNFETAARIKAQIVKLRKAYGET